MHTMRKKDCFLRGAWNPDLKELISVGIDISSSTSHLMFSCLLLQRRSLEVSSRFNEVMDWDRFIRKLLSYYRGK